MTNERFAANLSRAMKIQTAYMETLNLILKNGWRHFTKSEMDEFVRVSCLAEEATDSLRELRRKTKSWSWRELSAGLK